MVVNRFANLDPVLEFRWIGRYYRFTRNDDIEFPTELLPMPKIKFVKEKKEIEVEEGSNLRKVALREGIQLYPGIHKYVNCMGFAKCASCRVHITRGLEHVNRQGIFEKLRLIAGPITFFARLGHEQELRLACQTRVNGDIEVETQPEMNLHGDRFWG